MYSIKLDIGAGFKVIDNDIDGHNGITMSTRASLVYQKVPAPSVSYSKNH